MNSDNVHIKIEGQTANIILDKPSSGNALDKSLIEVLLDQFTFLSEDTSIRFIVLRSEGKHFCTGADLRWMRDSLNLSRDQNVEESQLLAKLFRTINNIEKITMAYVNGACIGGGVGLVAACDLVVASKQAYFSFAEVKLGLIPATIAPYILNRISKQVVKRTMLTGEKILASEAVDISLVDYIADDTGGIIETLIKGGEEAQLSIKKLIRELSNRSKTQSETDIYTSELIAGQRITEEAQEGMKAFLEKRTPKWISGK